MNTGLSVWTLLVFAALSVTAGDPLEITLGDDTLTLPVTIDDRVADRTVRVPLGYVAADVLAAASVRKG